MMEAGFFRPALLAAAVLALPAFYLVWRKSTRFAKAVALSRALIVLIVVAAAAQPYMETSKSFLQQPEVVLLEDRSSSTELIQKPGLEFEQLQKTERVIASGNTSDLRNGITRNLESDTSYLAVSDFQTTGESLGGLAEEFNRRNATLNALKPETEEDAAVSIEGPDTTVPGAQNTYTVEVSSTGLVPEPALTVDGEEVQLERGTNQSWQFKRTFDSRGSHALEASIEDGGEFEVNDRYYKAVQVVEKPDVLFIGEQGALGEKLSEFYDLTYRDSVPEDLSPYYTVIASKDVKDESLVPYVVEGNGLVYTADPTEDSLSVLPVRKAETEDKGIKLMIVVDASESSGGECINRIEDVCVERASDSGAIKKTKKIAAALLDRDGIPSNSKAGAVYYSDEASLISEPKVLAVNNHRDKLYNGILNIPTSGPSEHNKGIRAAQQILNGTGNIIWISDGGIGDYERYYNVSRDTRDLAESSEVKIISVGVGEETNEEFMKEISSLSGGYHVPRDSALSFTFAGGGASGASINLIRNDENHFIISGIELEATVNDFDNAEPKRGSSRLVSGSNTKPFLTVWRYGLGGVAAFSADTKQLEQTLADDPLLVSRTVAWTVGDPKRKQERWIRSENARSPEAVELTANYDPGGFTKESKETYSREFQPGSPGFYNYSGKLVSYNYPEEYENVGYSDQMEQLVARTGGSVYTPDQKKEIARDVKSFSKEEAVKKTSLSPFLLAAALLLFLSEVGYRKVNGKK